MKQRMRQPIPASSRRTFFKPEAAAVQPKISGVFSARSVLLTFGSLNIVYPRGIMFTQPFWKTIFRLPKPPSHQIRPASRQIIPIPLHQNALKETYFLLGNVSLIFLIVCGFPIQTWQKLLEYGNQPAGCLFARYPIQPKFCLRLKF